MKTINVSHIILGFFCIGLLLMQNLLVSADALAQGPPPRPVPGVGSGSGNSGNSDNDGNSKYRETPGDITGTVKDLSTGLPGAGLTVMINGIPLRTDTSGRFSLTGIPDGVYSVKLALPAELISAEASQTVTIANRNKVDIFLGFYSIKPQPEMKNPPQEMPETGQMSAWSYLKRGDVIGVFAILLGAILQILGRNLSKTICSTACCVGSKYSDKGGLF
ncbi:MAG: carboxypeptidase-like regulatory domain-containing protein [Anaerolineales bacterium]|nr:carboxypeptidase-like regulatory domain-containing protein [Anaerolineales bacterium]